jgi:integrase/recombinase XerD
MKNIIAERVMHKGMDRVTLRFPYDAELIKIVRGLPDARWSKQMGCWQIEDSKDIIAILLKAFYGKAYVDYSALKPNLAEKIRLKREEEQRKKDLRSNSLNDQDLPQLSEKGKEDLEKYRRWMESHRYPETTIRTYTGMVTTFLRFVSPKEASGCTSDDLLKLTDEYILPSGLSYSFQNQMISAVKKFYGKIYKSVIDPGEISRPRPQHRLPNVLSKEEVKKILDAPVNEKHRVMLSVIYACGLRRSELIGLIPSDIEKDRKLLRIRQSKGYKDRVVPISEKLIEMIGTYFTRYKPVTFLFEGQYRGLRYSASSLDKVFKEACKRAGIKREVTLHGLRHSYATHLLESGTDLRYIQELLGHRSSRTTEIYTHVTTQSIQKIRSPFDDL